VHDRKQYKAPHYPGQLSIQKKERISCRKIIKISLFHHESISQCRNNIFVVLSRNLHSNTANLFYLWTYANVRFGLRIHSWCWRRSSTQHS